MDKTIIGGTALALGLSALAVIGPQALAQRADEAPRAFRFEKRFHIGVPGHPGMPLDVLGPVHEDLLGEIAKALGISREALRAEHEAGRSFAEIAEAHGKSKDEVVDAVREAMRAAHEARIEAAVKAGKLTREQADRMLEGFQIMIQLDDLPLGDPRVGAPPMAFGFTRRIGPGAEGGDLSEDGTFELFVPGGEPGEDVLLPGAEGAVMRAMPFPGARPLDTATFAAVSTVLKDAVAAGKLSQDQADAALERLDPAKAAVPGVKVFEWRHAAPAQPAEPAEPNAPSGSLAPLRWFERASLAQPL
jgi:hypothetical protein